MVPKKHGVIPVEIVYNIKDAEEGNIDRLKAYLKACRMIPIYKVDNNETFPSTIGYNTLCIFLAIVSKNNSKLH